MASTRENALQALQVALAAAVAPTIVIRNEPRPQDISGLANTALVILRDGDPGVPEQTFGVVTYYWQHQAEVEILAQRNANDDRAAALDDLAVSIGAALDADKTLGGAVDHVIPGGVVVDHEQEEAGTLPYGTGLMIVELWFETTSPIG